MTDKTLMNEVLPTPTPNANGSPRDRVRAQMKKIISRGLIVGGAAAVCPSCVAVDPLPEPCDTDPDNVCIDDCDATDGVDPDCADAGSDPDGG